MPKITFLIKILPPCYNVSPCMFTDKHQACKEISFYIFYTPWNLFLGEAYLTFIAYLKKKNLKLMRSNFILFLD